MAEIYRTHTTREINETLDGKMIRAAGWVENIRDHGGVLFMDLRDHYGVLQVVMNDSSLMDGISKEYCVSVEGRLRIRTPDSYNPKINTGTVELVAEKIDVLGAVTERLPFDVQTASETKEELRLKYRFLDLRNRELHERIVFRSEVVAYMRELMREEGFIEISTPILTASSPEGARDYLVPSRKHKGKFYALPQAPQIFKQLLMVSGFDRYFQIAPCFRDEDARADRAPGEFYQLDFEMAFATQDDVLSVAERVLYKIFRRFSSGKVTEPPFERIPYAESMLKYGTDKPDLRNPLVIIDLTDFFAKCDFAPFKGRNIVRAIRVPGGAKLSKGFHEKMLAYATGELGMKGLGYITVNEDLSYKGPIDKFIPAELKSELKTLASLERGDLLFFISDKPSVAPGLAGGIRTKLGAELGLIEENAYRFAFIVDFPMYEWDDETGKWAFTHNPFSMPQGGLEALNTMEPDKIVAYQYDVVLNGVELSSGAVRNHEIDTMIKAFDIAGYSREELEKRFGSLYTAFKYGAPPHAGMAPGVDRILMLLTGSENIREVIAFPMNKNAQDLLMGAPGEVMEQQLREIHVKVRD